MRFLGFISWPQSTLGSPHLQKYRRMYFLGGWQSVEADATFPFCGNDHCAGEFHLTLIWTELHATQKPCRIA